MNNYFFTYDEAHGRAHMNNLYKYKLGSGFCCWYVKKHIRRNSYGDIVGNWWSIHRRRAK
jgi:hypothetical protein